MKKIINLGNSINNFYVYEHQDKNILVDTGLERNFPIFNKNLKKNNIKINEISYIFYNSCSQ